MYQDLYFGHFRFSTFQTTMTSWFAARTLSEAWACTAAQQMCAALEYIHFKAVPGWWAAVGLWEKTKIKPSPKSRQICGTVQGAFPNGGLLFVLLTLAHYIYIYIEATNQMFIAEDGIEWWVVCMFFAHKHQWEWFDVYYTTNSRCALYQKG